MNFRRTVISIIVSVLFSSAYGESVSRKEAQQFASDFFIEAFGRVVASPKFVYNGKRLASDRLFTPFYVFNNPSGGFVIVAADNKAFPILAYSLVDSFNPDNMSAGVRALLSGYSREVEYIRLDSRIPEEAIAAWTNRSDYISSVLGARFDSNDPSMTPSEARDAVHAIAGSYDAAGYSSEIYTPGQWEDAIGEELESTGNVAIGFPLSRTFPTGVVHGRKGDYFRIDLDGRNNAFYRLSATEFFIAPQIAVTGKPMAEPEIIEEEIPFAFHDGFMEEQRRESALRQRRLEDSLSVTEPQVRFIGGGHFEILFPEEIRMARVYSLSGAQISTLTFKNTSVVHVDLSANPQGFYFLLANGIDGRPYGLKLVR